MAVLSITVDFSPNEDQQKLTLPNLKFQRYVFSTNGARLVFQRATRIWQNKFLDAKLHLRVCQGLWPSRSEECAT